MSAVVAPTQPAQGGIDIATAPLAEVREQLRSRSDEPGVAPVAQPQEQGGTLAGLVAEVTQPRTAEDPQGSSTRGAAPVAGQPPAPEAQGNEARQSGEQPQAAPQRQRRPPPDTLEGAQRELATAYGNIQQLQQIRAQEQELVRQARDQQERFSRQQEEQRQETQRRDRAMYFQNVASLGLEPAQQQELLTQYDQQIANAQFAQDLGGYHGYLTQAHGEIEQTRQQLDELRTMSAREALPDTMRGFADFAAERFNVPPTRLQAFLATPNMRQAYALYHRPEHLAIIGEVVASVAEWLGAEEAQQRAGNAQQALERGTYRAELPVGTGGGPSTAQAIEGMSREQFKEFQQRVRSMRPGM